MTTTRLRAAVRRRVGVVQAPAVRHRPRLLGGRTLQVVVSAVRPRGPLVVALAATIHRPEVASDASG